MLAEVLVVALLIVANGVFSLAELAVVAAPKGVLQEAADAGSRGARAALRLMCEARKGRVSSEESDAAGDGPNGQPECLGRGAPL
ncbi:MAG: DUF21 domain-containing protein [Deltaproteobacteria bacterium]|nr:DUF21 domain-containing protein [Deltaproteobacteria bacterium]